MEPKRVPKQSDVYQIVFIMMLWEYNRFKQCKNAIKVDVGGVFLSNLGKCTIDNLLLTLWKFVAENDTEKSQLLWNSILQKEMLHWKFFSAF